MPFSSPSLSPPFRVQAASKDIQLQRIRLGQLPDSTGGEEDAISNLTSRTAQNHSLDAIGES